MKKVSKDFVIFRFPANKFIETQASWFLGSLRESQFQNNQAALIIWYVYEWTQSNNI